jgi:hypothetical protein
LGFHEPLIRQKATLALFVYLVNVDKVIEMCLPISNFYFITKFSLTYRMKKTCLFSILYLGIFCLNTSSLYAQTVTIPTNITNPLRKDGYHLIFDDEFDTFNADFWSRSKSGDDGPNYGVTDFCKLNLNTPNNISNILTPDAGILRERVRKGEDIGACDFSGGEIKTFSNDKWSAKNKGTYKDWKVSANTYIETRLKTPVCAGVGSAFWLYNTLPNRIFEVDVFEAYSDDDKHLQTNIHYGKSYQDKKTDSHKVKIKNTNGGNFALNNQFVTHGVELKNGSIQTFMNNKTVSCWNLSPNGNTNPYAQLMPLNIRIGTGGPSLNSSLDPSKCENLPVFQEVDYVRVYIKDGFKAVSLLTPPVVNFCNQFPWEGTNVSVNYFPTAVYTWEESPYFKFEINPNAFQGCDCQQWWLSFRNPDQLPPVGTYSLKLVTLFTSDPLNYKEELTLVVEIKEQKPPVPSSIDIISNGNSDFSVGTPIMNTTEGYEWSIDKGLTWERIPNATFGSNAKENILNKVIAMGGPEIKVLDVCVRSYNSCGISDEICKTVTVEKDDDCSKCLVMLLPPTEVYVELMKDSFYTLKVPKLPLSDGYEWGIDSTNFTEVSNIENESDAFNYFGRYEVGTPKFWIYVRGKSDGIRTHVYRQEIVLPDTIKATIGKQSIEAEHYFIDTQLETYASSTTEENTFSLFNSMGIVIVENTDKKT